MNNSQSAAKSTKTGGTLKGASDFTGIPEDEILSFRKTDEGYSVVTIAGQKTTQSKEEREQAQKEAEKAAADAEKAAQK